MQVLIDGDVLLDVVLGREPFRAEYIVTRNLRDYRNSPVPAISPSQFAATILRGPDLAP